MRALDRGETFVVTRNGVPVGELTPLQQRRFVSADAAVGLFAGGPVIDGERGVGVPSICSLRPLRSLPSYRSTRATPAPSRNSTASSKSSPFQCHSRPPRLPARGLRNVSYGRNETSANHGRTERCANRP